VLLTAIDVIELDDAPPTVPQKTGIGHSDEAIKHPRVQLPPNRFHSITALLSDQPNSPYSHLSVVRSLAQTARNCHVTEHDASIRPTLGRNTARCSRDGPCAGPQPPQRRWSIRASSLDRPSDHDIHKHSHDDEWASRRPFPPQSRGPFHHGGS
jgi:hypothetical protein